jgi:hypothetical protein
MRVGHQQADRPTDRLHAGIARSPRRPEAPHHGVRVHHEFRNWNYFETVVSRPRLSRCFSACWAIKILPPTLIRRVAIWNRVALHESRPLSMSRAHPLNTRGCRRKLARARTVVRRKHYRATGCDSIIRLDNNDDGASQPGAASERPARWSPRPPSNLLIRRGAQQDAGLGVARDAPV